jgi:hypothetical protein
MNYKPQPQTLKSITTNLKSEMAGGFESELNCFSMRSTLSPTGLRRPFDLDSNCSGNAVNLPFFEIHISALGTVHSSPDYLIPDYRIPGSGDWLFR